MEIIELKLKNYKKFKNTTLRFESGLNVLIKPNEFGKSTIAKAILDAFFADPATRSKAFMSEIAPWEDPDAPAVIELSFRAAGENYLLIKDFGNKTALLTNRDSGKSINTTKAIDVAMQQLMGLESKVLYQATAYINQKEIAAVSDSTNISRELQKVLLSSAVNTDVGDTIRKLESENRQAQIGIDRPAKNPGVIKSLSDELADLQRSYVDLKERWAKIEEAGDKLLQSGEEVVQLNKRIKLLEDLLANSRKLQDAKLKLERLDKQIDVEQQKLNKANQFEHKLGLMQSNLKNYHGFADQNAEEVGRRLTSYKEAIKLAAIDLDRLKAVSAAQQKVKPKGSSQTFGIFLFLCAMAVLGGGFAWIVTKVIIWLALGIVAGGVTFVIGVVVNSAKRSPDEVKQIDENEYMLDQNLKRKKLAEEKTAEILSAFGVKNVEEFFAVKAEYAALQEQLKDERANIQIALGGKSYEEIDKALIELIRQKREVEINELTAEVKLAHLGAEEIMTKTRDLENFYTRRRELERELAVSSSRVEESGVEYEDVLYVESKIEQVRQRLELEKEKVAANEMIIETLHEAVSAVASQVNVHVHKLAGEILPKLTDNEYNDIKLEDNFSVLVKSAKTGRWVAPNSGLSSGAIDQIYLTIRLALLRSIAKKQKPVLLLDDIFVTFDSTRLAKTKKVIDEFARDVQIILMTHNASYAAWGKEIKVID